MLGAGARDADRVAFLEGVLPDRMRRHLADLIPLFGSTGHHHIPVVGDGGTLVGMITQSDLVAALTVKVET